MKFTDVPIPKRMRGLAKDKRGYPVPFVVLRDTDGRPHYTVNDTEKVARCLREGRCPVCGNRLDRELWFVGGPLSAFHAQGAYLDTALHHDCMTYALQVCPYLAVPNYLGRIDTATVDRAKVPEDYTIFMNEMVIPERPAVFVAVASLRQQLFPDPTGLAHTSRPLRPYIAIEYWRNGERISDAEGEAIVGEAIVRKALSKPVAVPEPRLIPKFPER